jgi:hypothetical protein
MGLLLIGRTARSAVLFIEVIVCITSRIRVPRLKLGRAGLFTAPSTSKLLGSAKRKLSFQKESHNSQLR